MFKVGIIFSSVGSALAAAGQIIRSAGYTLEYFILADRECGILEWGKEFVQTYKIIELKNGSSSSSSAKDYFEANSVNIFSYIAHGLLKRIYLILSKRVIFTLHYCHHSQVYMV